MLNGLDLAMWTGLHDLKVQTHKHDSGLLKVGIKIKRKKKLLNMLISMNIMIILETCS
jgi:hypothetical protein